MPSYVRLQDFARRRDDRETWGKRPGDVEKRACDVGQSLRYVGKRPCDVGKRLRHVGTRACDVLGRAIDVAVSYLHVGKAICSRAKRLCARSGGLHFQRNAVSLPAQRN